MLQNYNCSLIINNTLFSAHALFTYLFAYYCMLKLKAAQHWQIKSVLSVKLFLIPDITLKAAHWMYKITLAT